MSPTIPARWSISTTAVGATLVVGFGDKETVTAVAVTNSKDLKAMPKGNFLFFKSQEVLPVQPVIWNHVRRRQRVAPLRLRDNDDAGRPR